MTLLAIPCRSRRYLSRSLHIACVLFTLAFTITFTAFSSHQSSHVLAATTSPMGINVDGIADWSPTFVFTDLVKQGRAWGTIATPWDGAAAVDANLWPTTDAAIILMGLDNSRFGDKVNGTYKVTFNGQASIRGYDGGGGSFYTISNQSYDSSTNTTTADLEVPLNDANLWLAFTNTKRTGSSAANTGITNLKVILPGYPADGSQLFTTPFLNSFSPFQSFRAMDLASTNNSTIVNWSDRATPSTALQSQKGVAWEYIIQLANQTGKDVWVNIPHQATDDYVTQLATLIKNNLNSNLNVYVEYSNEVWNFGFQQAGWNQDQAQLDPDLRWDGADNQFQLATRRVGKRIGQISNIFKNVWGSGAINNRVRPVLAWQVGNTWGLQQQLDTIQHLFGTPSQYIYAVATAPYMHEGDGNGVSQDTSSVDAIINGLYADSDNNKTAMQNVTTLAHNNNLKHLAYEGGTHTPGSTNLDNRIAANRDARMKDLLLHDIGTNWFGTGGDMYMYFTDFSDYGQFGMWGLSESVFDTNTPKWQAIQQLATSGTGSTPTPNPTSTPTSTPPSTGNWMLCANEGGTCTFSGTHQVRYGANGTYNYQTATGSISCTNAVFGDPTPGVVKHCDVSSDTPTATATPTPTATSTPTPTSTATTWTKCADEGGTCTFSGTHQVRYGANGTYNYQTATNSIGCNNSVFGDPTPGVVKACYYS